MSDYVAARIGDTVISLPPEPYETADGLPAQITVTNDDTDRMARIEPLGRLVKPGESVRLVWKTNGETGLRGHPIGWWYEASEPSA